jgi:hypothetical protein
LEQALDKIAHWFLISRALLFNLVFVILGSTLAEGPLRHLAAALFPSRSRGLILLRDSAITVVIAALLSWFVQKQWQSRSARWVWTICTIWFCCGAVRYAWLIKPEGGSFWEHFSGTECAAYGNRTACFDFFIFTFTVLRGISYSMAAWFFARGMKNR